LHLFTYMRNVLNLSFISPNTFVKEPTAKPKASSWTRRGLLGLPCIEIGTGSANIKISDALGQYFGSGSLL